jgi:hypothetical protein
MTRSVLTALCLAAAAVIGTALLCFNDAPAINAACEQPNAPSVCNRPLRSGPHLVQWPRVSPKPTRLRAQASA